MMFLFLTSPRMSECAVRDLCRIEVEYEDAVLIDLGVDKFERLGNAEFVVDLALERGDFPGELVYEVDDSIGVRGELRAESQFGDRAERVGLCLRAGGHERAYLASEEGCLGVGRAPTSAVFGGIANRLGSVGDVVRNDTYRLAGGVARTVNATFTWSVTAAPFGV